MKNKALTIIIVLITTLLNAQNYYTLEFNVYDENRNPKQFELAYAYFEQKELSWSITDEFGNIDFIFNNINNNIDSIYFIFNNNINADTIYLNEIRLIEDNISTHHIIVLQRFVTYSKQEFEEYKKKSQLLPDRITN